jgi:hypothetical protein
MKSTIIVHQGNKYLVLGEWGKGFDVYKFESYIGSTWLADTADEAVTHAIKQNTKEQ